MCSASLLKCKIYMRVSLITILCSLWTVHCAQESHHCACAWQPCSECVYVQMKPCATSDATLCFSEVWICNICCVNNTPCVTTPHGCTTISFVKSYRCTRLYMKPSLRRILDVYTGVLRRAQVIQ